MKLQCKFSASLTAVLMGTLLTSGCGKVKTHEDQTVKVSSTKSDETESQFKSIAELYDTYAPGSEGFSEDELKNIADKFRDQVEAIIGFKGLSNEEILEAVFQLYPDARSGISPKKINDLLKSNLFVMSWYDDKHAEYSEEELAEKLGGQFPQSSETSRAFLAKVLMRFDRKYLDGVENNKLSSKEMVLPAIILKTLSQLDYSHGIPLNFEGLLIGNSLTKDIAEVRLSQQILGRYFVPSLQWLQSEDLKLEFIALFLRYYQTKKIIDSDGVSGVLYPAQIAGAMKKALFVDIPETTDFSLMAKYYDKRLFGGDEDTNLNTLELFQMSMDIETAQKLKDLALAGTLAKSDYKSIYGRVGKKIIADTKVFPKPTGTETLESMDYKLLSIQATISIYRFYDKNGDDELSKSEFKDMLDQFDSLLEKYGIKDKRFIRIFFEDIGLNPNDKKWWTVVRLVFHKDDNDTLSPGELYTRVSKLLLKLVEDTQDEQQQLDKQK